jgi:tetratricopeptide (TPR) repeat protein
VRGKETHILNVDGVIRHARIPQEISNTFAADFRSVIPKSLMFSTENDALVFESASKWFDISTRYVVGVAAYLSGSVGYAELMFTQIETELSRAQELPPFIQSIAKKLPSRFLELYSTWNMAVHQEYFITGNNDFLRIEDMLTEKLLKRDPKNYSALLGKSIAEFVLRRNIARAKELVLRCKDSPDATWRYNIAFLLCYEGDLAKAHEEYRIAFKRFSNNVTTPIQCEEFIHKILAIEPDKTQLHFALGLINYNAKKDFNAAKADFTEFLKSQWPQKFPNETVLCERLINRCNEWIDKQKQESQPQ